MKRSLAVVAAGLLLLSPTSCASSGRESSDDKVLTVYAASSLTATFTELGREFERQHPGVQVRLNFAGSSGLLAQLQQGAPADVFASADVATMDKAVADRLTASEPVAFARNTLMIAVPPDNPAQVQTLQDLAEPDTIVVLCAPEVPCGAAAQQVQDAAGVTIRPASEEQSVSDVLTKVQSGEADAGLVYVTDVKSAADNVTGIAFPEAAAVVNTYPIATLAASKDPDLAADFVTLVTSTAGQQVLEDAGFAKP